MSGLGEHTNRIQDGTNRRAVYDALRHEPPRTLVHTLRTVKNYTVGYATIPWNCEITKIYAVSNMAGTGGVAERYSFGIALAGAGFIDLSGNIITVVTGATAGIAVSVTPTGASRRANFATPGSSLRIKNCGTSTGPTGGIMIFTALCQID